QTAAAARRRRPLSAGVRRARTEDREPSMLARSHRDFLTRDGYAVLSGLVPDRLLKAARDVICSFVGADLDRPETWYRHEPLVWSVVPVHHAQAFWDVRQWPASHATLAEIWATEKLWGTMDRGIVKAQERTECGKQQRAPAWSHGR